MGLFGTTIHNHIPKPEPQQNAALFPRLAAYDAVSLLRTFEEEARNKVLEIYRPEGNQIHCTVTVERGDFEIRGRLKLYVNGHEYDVPLSLGDRDARQSSEVVVERVREVLVKVIAGHVIEDVLRAMLPIYKADR